MSTQIALFKNSDENSGDREICFTRFYGGLDRGTCLQIGITYEYVALTESQVKTLITSLKSAFKGGEKDE